jgi:hypothetical protein
MKKIIKHIIVVCLVLMTAGISYHLLTVRQDGKEIEWSDVGEGGRNTADDTKEFYDSTKVKVIEVWDEIEEGYDKK